MNLSRLAVLTVLAVLAAACGAPANVVREPTITLPAGPGVVEATVTRVKVGLGPVFCNLHNSDAGPSPEQTFPGQSPIIGGSLTVEASSERVLCRFEKLPMGTYAISIIQDEDSDGDLRTSVFGAPIEGYGASNNILPATSGPTWADSKFEVGATKVELEIRLQY
jgi:uncharacterized protein (DUF2141 family)